MSIRGRKPTPTHLKILEGNPGKRPLNMNEPKPRPVTLPCPKWLDTEAKREWRRISKELEVLGLVTVIDRVALAGYCQAYARWKEAEEFLQKHGTIFVIKDDEGKSKYMQQVPQVSISLKYLQIVKAFCAEFGLSPSSRSRISVPDPTYDDDLEGILD